MTWAKTAACIVVPRQQGLSDKYLKLTTMRYAPEALTNTGNWSMDMINSEPADLKKI